MRRLKLYVYLFTILLFVSSCSTMDTSAVKEIDNAAVAIVGVDKHLEYSEDFEAAQLVQRLAQSDKFNLQPVAEDLHEKTLGEYTRVMPFELIPEEDVIGAERYQNFQLFDSESAEETFTETSNFITVKNYKAYNPVNMHRGHKTDFSEAIPEEADAMLLVGLNYKLVQENSLIPGVNKGKIEADLNMELVKPNGDRIININQKAKSNDDMKVVLDAAILDPDKIQPLVMEATDKVMIKASEFISDNLSG